MSVEGGRNGSLEGPLFASVLALGGADDVRARLLTWAPLAVLLHALLLWSLSEAARSPLPDTGSSAREETDRVLRLLSGARPRSGMAATPAPAHDAQPRSAPSLPRPTVAPKHRAPSVRRPPAPPPVVEPATGSATVEPMLPTRVDATPGATPTTEVPPEAISDTASPAGALPPTEGLITASPGTAGGMSLSGAELDGAARAAVGGVVGSILGSGNVGLFEAPSMELTDAQREEWLLRYAEQIIDARFEFVRYPHQAAAAGIRGLVVVKVSVGAKGQLLHHELLGRCPHYVLCDAAMELVKNAAPFPPPPSELGRPVQLELPFNFHL